MACDCNPPQFCKMPLAVDAFGRVLSVAQWSSHGVQSGESYGNTNTFYHHTNTNYRRTFCHRTDVCNTYT